MSAVPASTLFGSARGVPREERLRALEIDSSRSQKRARPRLIVAVVTVAGLFGILSAQLLLSIATSEGAYEISSLQARQAELARDQQVMLERLQILEAPQHLASEAQALGMVANSSAAYLRLADGAVLGAPVRATASAALMTAADGTSLIPNTLLADVPLVSQASPVVEGAPPVAGADPSVTSPTAGTVTPIGIPSPTTH